MISTTRCYPAARLVAARGFPAQEGDKTTKAVDTNAKNAVMDDGTRFFKTRICLFHQRGACVRGADCSYAHSESELKAVPDLMRTRLCQNWINGDCTAGNECKFAHGRQELRFTHDFYKTKLCYFWQNGGCNKGDLCRHAHGEHELRPNPLEQNESSTFESEHVKQQTITPTMTPATTTPATPPHYNASSPANSVQKRPIPTLSSKDSTQCSSRRPRPHGLHSQATSCGESSPCATHDDDKREPRQSAVLEALELAEEARRLVERSVQILKENGADTSSFTPKPERRRPETSSANVVRTSIRELPIYLENEHRVSSHHCSKAVLTRLTESVPHLDVTTEADCVRPRQPLNYTGNLSKYEDQGLPPRTRSSLCPRKPEQQCQQQRNTWHADDLERLLAKLLSEPTGATALECISFEHLPLTSKKFS